MKKSFVNNWNNMSLEDKILLVMELGCYFLTLCTLIVFFFAIKKGFGEGIIALILSMVGFMACGLNARSSRDSYVSELN
ncbi:MAG TPA: hypothetical protein GX725_02745 [Mollicutes bacterium]|nr:hypothetical protein [Mollicutes bacterium]